MKVEVFKTSVISKQQATSLIEELKKYSNVTKITFDLEDCDKILRIEAAHIQPNAVIYIVKKMGFECERLV